MEIENGNEEKEPLKFETVKEINFDEEIMGELIENMPNVSEHIIENGETEDKGILGDNPKLEEKSGFNPEIHCTDKNGNPVLTKNGAFRKRSGRSAGNGVKSTINHSSSQSSNQSIKENSPIVLSREEVAKASAEEIDLLYWSAMNGIFPTSINESVRAQVSPVAVSALADGFAQMEEVPKIHWSVVVGAIYLSSTMAILKQPETKSTMQKIKDKLTLWFVKRKQGQAERSA